MKSGQRSGLGSIPCISGPDNQPVSEDREEYTRLYYDTAISNAHKDRHLENEIPGTRQISAVGAGSRTLTLYRYPTPGMAAGTD